MKLQELFEEDDDLDALLSKHQEIEKFNQIEVGKLYARLAVPKKDYIYEVLKVVDIYPRDDDEYGILYHANVIVLIDRTSRKPHPMDILIGSQDGSIKRRDLVLFTKDVIDSFEKQYVRTKDVIDSFEKQYAPSSTTVDLKTYIDALRKLLKDNS